MDQTYEESLQIVESWKYVQIFSERGCCDPTWQYRIKSTLGCHPFKNNKNSSSTTSTINDAVLQSPKQKMCRNPWLHYRRADATTTANRQHFRLVYFFTTSRCEVKGGRSQGAGFQLISCEIKISPYELRVGVNFSGSTIRSAVLRLWKHAKGHLHITSNRRDLYYDIFFLLSVCCIRVHRQAPILSRCKCMRNCLSCYARLLALVAEINRSF